MADDENTKTSAIYTFELALWPAPQVETVRFICSSEEEAWTALLHDQPKIGALYQLVKTEPLSVTQAELAALLESVLRSVSTNPLTLEQAEQARQRWLSTASLGRAPIDREIELAMQALLEKVGPLI
jgi:hypothetical protein